jgi:molybdopterin molybdotransferase
MLAIQDICDRPGLLDIEQALTRVLSYVTPIEGTDDLTLHEATGRVVIDAVRSTIPLPPFDQSAVDGYAVLEQNLAISPRVLRRIGRVAAGSAATVSLNPGETTKLLTGAPIPAGVRAVVMEEKVRFGGPNIIIDGAIEPGMNIRRRGEDVEEGAEIVGATTILDARHIAILAAAGTDRVTMRRRVRVAVMSTGDELVAAGTSLGDHQLNDANGPMLMSLVSSPATQVDYLGRHPDDRLALAQAFANAAASYDLILCSGGVSGSDADHVVPAIEDAGGECRAMSLALKPGKPLAAGHIGATAILALPGNPAAAMVGALVFARPMLEALAGLTPSKLAAMAARTAGVFAHRPGRAEFVPVATLGTDSDGVPRVEKLGRGGSARLRPLILADGLACIPAATGDLETGHAIDFYPFKSRFGL